MRENKGINLVTLSIAIIILVVITSVLVYSAKDGVRIKNLEALYNDIESLNSKVSTYYLENGDIPKGKIYSSKANNTNIEFISMLENAETLNPNDSNTYYVLDLKSLDNISLNYGRDYDYVASSTNLSDLKDLYVINEKSHTIYYVAGVQVENVTYYTNKTDYSNIDLKIIPIYTAEQLAKVAEATSSGKNETVAIEQEDGQEYVFTADSIYSLQNDIDLSDICYKVDGTIDNDKSWTPIGTPNTPFKGEFWGNGYEISGIYINTDNTSQGLFGRITDSVIKDVTTKGEITANRHGAGIAGHVTDGTIKNCISYVNVEGTNTQDVTQCGGMCGTLIGGSISNCKNYGKIISNTSTGGQNGGICGFAYYDAVIENCENNGEINSHTGGARFGGIVGLLGYAERKGTVINCINKADIIGYIYTGGICGQASFESYIYNCENYGKTKGYSNYAGGICAFVNEDAIIERCKNEGDVELEKNKTIAGGIVGILGTFDNVSNGYTKWCINNGNVTADRAIGGVIGQYRGGEIYRCTNTGDVGYILGNDENTGWYIGEIAGHASYSIKGMIEQCINQGRVRGIHCVGGIVGISNNCTISQTVNQGEITRDDNDGVWQGGQVGGIIGVNAYNGKSEVLNCYNKGNIVASGTVGGSGGIAGSNLVEEINYNTYSESILKNNYNIGNLYSDKSGGITYNKGGKNTGIVTLENNYWLSTCGAKYGYYYEQTNNGSEPKSATEMKLKNFVALLNSGNTEEIWVMDTKGINNGYPILKWQLED